MFHVKRQSQTIARRTLSSGNVLNRIGNWFSLHDLIGMEFLVALDLLGKFLNIVFDYILRSHFHSLIYVCFYFVLTREKSNGYITLFSFIGALHT